MNSVAYEVISLKLHWRELGERPEGVRLQETVDIPALAKENRQLVACTPIEVDVHASAASGIALVRGDLKTKATYRCSRCLCDFSEDLHVPFDEQFMKTDKLENGDDMDDEERFQVVGDEFELEPYLEQAMNLALPYSPVCRQDCAGLCPVCGVNRNEGTCSCNTERIDPRLADLAKFFEQS